MSIARNKVGVFLFAMKAFGQFDRKRLRKLAFEPDIVSVQLDGTQLPLEPGQTVIPHGPDRDLTVAEALPLETAMSEPRKETRCFALSRTSARRSRASGRARWHAHADKQSQDGRASGPNQSGATWLDYYR